MTVLEREMMEAIVRMAQSLDELNKQIKTQNEILIEMVRKDADK